MAWRSTQQAKQAKGNLQIKLVRDANLTFWTLTAWESEAAMRAYMMAGSHRDAMPKLLNWCDEASVVHWHQDTDELPSLAEAHHRMLTEGRISKVNYPSPNHLAHHIAQPKTHF
jgi:quinol monooxygenase YgiN